MMENLVYELSDEIKEFLNHFWPGPLTVVMKKKEIIPDAVSCGLDTVAIRMPNNEIARSFIKQCGVPIAAPSANISGKPSPTTADEILIDDAIVTENTIPKSPGQKYKHYAPKAKVVVISAKDRKKSSIEIEKIIKENKDLKIGIFKFDETFLNVESENILSLGSVFDLREMSKILFRGLREFDENNVDLIVVEGCDEKGLGFSIMNRLKKSASGNIKYID